MKFGGFLDYSKFEVLQQISSEFRPGTKLIRNKNQFRPNKFPFIVKPDLGERGVNVELVKNEKDWANYPLREDLIIQEFVDFPLEFGIFYARIPGEEKGNILSVTGKEFLAFVSDGKTTLRKFIETHPRSRNRTAYLFNKFKDELDIIYPEGTKILLEPIGNHNRGTRFFDASYLISDELTEKTDFISKQISGFHYGRFDVKAGSVEDFRKGNFIILEINGANSEPTHIYDSGFSLSEAYKEVKRHLDIQYKISGKNPKRHSSGEFYKAVFRKILYLFR